MAVMHGQTPGNAHTSELPIWAKPKPMSRDNKGLPSTYTAPGTTSLALYSFDALGRYFTENYSGKPASVWAPGMAAQRARLRYNCWRDGEHHVDISGVHAAYESDAKSLAVLREDIIGDVKDAVRTFDAMSQSTLTRCRLLSAIESPT